MAAPAERRDSLMSIVNETADVAILGGDPGGYVAALCAARRGARVVLVEKARVGGTCLNVGCIPTKALATTAELLVRSKRASEFGLSIAQVDVDLPRLMDYKRGTVDKLVAGVEQLLRARRVRVVRGKGQLSRSGKLLVETVEGGPQELSAKHVILAPASVTAEPPIEGRHLPGVVTSTEALDIDKIMAYEIFMMPGLVINGQVRAAGRIPKLEELKGMLQATGAN
jgi:dihydrolipoamide dehydrogenase